MRFLPSSHVSEDRHPTLHAPGNLPIERALMRLEKRNGEPESRAVGGWGPGRLGGESVRRLRGWACPGAEACGAVWGLWDDSRE